MEGALKDLTRAIKLTPDYYRAYTYRGKVYLSGKNYRKALQDFEQALRLRPGNAEALGWKAKAEAKLSVQAGAPARD